MYICIVGWYFSEHFVSKMLLLREMMDGYEIVWVCHKHPPGKFPFPYIVIPNIGLEFGVYNFFLKNIWNGKTNVLFTHDDTIVNKLMVFKYIREIKHDCAYIFRDYPEEVSNGGKHGRAIFCSANFLTHLSNDGGFWFDEENMGYVGNGQPRPLRADGTPIDFNAGIYNFHRYLGRVRDAKIGLDVVNRVFFSEYECGRRGTWRHKEAEWKRYGAK